MVKTTILTADGLRQLEEELEYLKTEKRQEVAEKIKQARAYGDLSENSEYDEAKNEQAQVESRIMELEEKLKNIKLIDEENIDTTVVGLGVTVKVLDCEFDEEVEYTIVGSTESDPSKNRISDESPVGKALLGAHVGETVEAQVPSGATLAFKVLDIRK
ncbi:MAG: transcription elongation factor GreA [Clostridia bacterium]|nr:transcription elongation factor GreA [Oscillospiraceae bacterium]MBQ7033238.1 transcription elongation factor GreA [Clostridia bacterium]